MSDKLMALRTPAPKKIDNFGKTLSQTKIAVMAAIEKMQSKPVNDGRKSSRPK